MRSTPSAAISPTLVILAPRSVTCVKTNREIAQRLFITEKTAGSHVSGILAALGVRSRVEAATTAHLLGLVTIAEPGGKP